MVTMNKNEGHNGVDTSGFRADCIGESPGWSDCLRTPPNSQGLEY